jgi:hypothetical protein
MAAYEITDPQTWKKSETAKMSSSEECFPSSKRETIKSSVKAPSSTQADEDEDETKVWQAADVSSI